MLKALVLPSIHEDESGESTHIIRKAMFFVVVLLGGFFLWASLAPISGAVIAEGKIKIATNRKTVQHLEGGIVKQILVRDGDLVKKGQPLLLLESSKDKADFNIARDIRDSLLAKEARLAAERSLANNINFPTTLLEPSTAVHKELIAKELSLFQSKRKILNDQISLLKTELSQSKDAADSYQTQLDAIKESIQNSQLQLQMREDLMKKNFVNKTDVLSYRQSVADKKSQLGEQSANFNITRARVSDLELQIINTKNQYIQQADNDLKDTVQQLLTANENLRAAEDSFSRLTIAAPIAGQVIALKVTTVGGVVSPSEPLMDIVPLSDDLVIEVNLKNSDIDSVYVGQPAEIQLNAFNQRITPMVKGKVIYVAADAIDNPQTGISTYPAHIKVDDEALKNLQHVKIEPGMPATGYIKTESRTLIQYFLSPIMIRMRHTFREE